MLRSPNISVQYEIWHVYSYKLWELHVCNTRQFGCLLVICRLMKPGFLITSRIKSEYLFLRDTLYEYLDIVPNTLIFLVTSPWNLFHMSEKRCNRKFSKYQIVQLQVGTVEILTIESKPTLSNTTCSYIPENEWLKIRENAPFFKQRKLHRLNYKHVIAVLSVIKCLSNSPPRATIQRNTTCTIY